MKSGRHHHSILQKNSTLIKFNYTVSSIKKPLPTILVYSIILCQFMFNSLVGDDWPNSQIMKFVTWRYGKMDPPLFFHEIYYWVSNWAIGQGRFYPLSYLQQQIYFYFFGGTRLLNLAYGITFILLLLIWAKVIATFTKKSNIELLVGLFAIPLVRFRFDFEPHLGFSQISLWPLIWVGISIILYVKYLERKELRLAVFSSLLLLAALNHYEISITLLPLYLLIFLNSENFKQKQYRKTIASFIRSVKLHILVTGAYLAFVFGYLRPKAHPSGNYVIGFQLLKSLRTLIFQDLSVIPLTGMPIADIFKFPSSKNLVAILLLSFGLLFIVLNTKFAGFSTSVNKNKKVTNDTELKNENFGLLFFIYLIVAPGFIVALQPTQWQMIKFGHPYLGITFSEIGLIGLITILFERISEKNIPRNTRSKRNTQKTIAGYLGGFLLIYIPISFSTLSNNYRFIETTKNRDNISSTWSAVTKKPDLFHNVKNSDVFISTTTNDAYEINVADFYLKTHKRLAQFFLPQYLWSDYLECPNSNCKLDNIERRINETLPNSSRPKSTIIYWNGTKSSLDDYPTKVLKDGLIKTSSIWYFNIYQLTPNTGVAYLVKMTKDPIYAKVDLSTLRVAMVYSDVSERNLKPSLNGICLSDTPAEMIDIHTEFGARHIAIWNANQNLNFNKSKFIDPRQLSLSSCV